MKIAFLTAGGIAPCLSSSIGSLIEKYKQHVQGFPTVILFDSSDNLKKVYEGERTAAGLTAFVEKHAS